MAYVYEVFQTKTFGGVNMSKPKYIKVERCLSCPFNHHKPEREVREGELSRIYQCKVSNNREIAVESMYDDIPEVILSFPVWCPIDKEE